MKMSTIGVLVTGFFVFSLTTGSDKLTQHIYLTLVVISLSATLICGAIENGQSKH